MFKKVDKMPPGKLHQRRRRKFLIKTKNWSYHAEFHFKKKFNKWKSKMG